MQLAHSRQLRSLPFPQRSATSVRRFRGVHVAAACSHSRRVVNRQRCLARRRDAHGFAGRERAAWTPFRSASSLRATLRVALARLHGKNCAALPTPAAALASSLSEPLMAGTEAAVAADVQVAPVGVPQPQHDTSVRAFLKVTSVRQAVLLFLGSLFYDIGSIACVPCLSRFPRRTPAADSAVRSPCNPGPQIPHRALCRRRLLHHRLRKLRLQRGAGLEADGRAE